MSNPIPMHAFRQGKRLVLSAALCLSILTACGSDESATPTALPSAASDLSSQRDVDLDEKRAADAFDFEEAIADVLQQASRGERIRHLSTLMTRVDAENLEEARRVMLRDRSWFEKFEYELFIEAWARVDPESAVESAERAWGSGTFLSGDLVAAIHGWALYEPDAAARKVDELIETYPRQRKRLINTLIKGWAVSGKPGLLEYTANLREEHMGFRVDIIALRRTRRLRVPAVLEWMDDVVERDLPADFRRRLFKSVTMMAARRDPGAVAPWWKQHEGKPYAEGSLPGLVNGWVTHDASSAFRWALEAVPEDDLSNVLGAAFDAWLSGDFDRARIFIESAPRDPIYDSSIAAYARNLAKSEPEAALQLVEQIQGEAIRLAALENVASMWRRKAPKDAETWLVDSPLTSEARERVRQGSPTRKSVRR